MKSKHHNQHDLSLFSLTWPIFVEVLLHMVMGNVDTLMLSQYSDKSVAAVGVSNQILSVMIVMFGFISTGTGIVIAQYLGANQEKEAATVTVTALVMNLFFGLLLSVVIFLFSKPILALTGLPQELMGEANLYIAIVGGFLFLQALIMTCSIVLRNYGHTKDAMYVTLGMNGLNIIGNYILIFGHFGMPQLGVTGVAVATVCSRFIGFLVLVILVRKRANEPLPFRHVFSIPKKEIKQILQVGIPAAGEHLAYNTSQMMIMVFINMMGTEAITTKVYTQNIMMFIFLFSVAIGQGTQIMIGHLAGARKYKEAYNRCIRSLQIAIVISLTAGLVFFFFAEPVLSIFTNNHEVMTLGAQLLLLTIILEPGRAFNLVVISSLRGAGDVRFPVYMGILSMWGVSVTVSYILGIHYQLGLIGVWISFIMDEWFRGLIMLKRWRSRAWVKKGFVKST
ncbi:MATE family efflux transporter [Salirhabdus salicampi]|uniref:MATE family efflux transporter n=1 Tax=Salirhabdus salicampi TaxID=476102 RepID=UPI0020C3C422|nr:MATE family efflux transporter [Salirhabdus salicampi]MCP8615457.1 MATE family efflux transporter [Salirhabdus salicampi]